MALDMKYNSDMKSGDYIFDGSGTKKEEIKIAEYMITMDGSVDTFLENRINFIDIERKRKGLPSFRKELLKIQNELLDEGIDKDIIVTVIRELVDKEGSEYDLSPKFERLRVTEVQTINPENINNFEDLFGALEEYKSSNNVEDEVPGIGRR